jgi:uncharacterized integral membrane protein
MSRPRIVITAVLAVVILVLIVQNTEVVAIRVLFWDFQMSRVILILLTSLTGFVCGYLFARILDARRGRPGADEGDADPGAQAW